MCAIYPGALDGAILPSAHTRPYVWPKPKASRNIDLNVSSTAHPLIHMTKPLSMGCADRLLSYWMQWIENEVDSHELAITVNASLPALNLDHGPYLSMYIVFVLVFAAGLFFEALVMMIAGIRSSNSLHFQCLNTLMHAPVSWFDATPSGRILSRFSSDLSVVDLFLPRYIDSAAQFGVLIVVLAVVLAMVLPLMLPEVLVCFCLFGLEIKAAMRITQDSKRVANNAMNPVQSTLAEIEQGQDNHLSCSAMQKHGSAFPLIRVFSLMVDLA